MKLKDCLLKQYEEMIEYRISMGYSISTDVSMLRKFIDFVIENFGDCEAISKEIFDAWLMFKNYSSKGWQAAFISTYRHFANYLLLRGIDIFYPDRDYNVKRLRYHAFILSKQELSNLFYAIDTYSSRIHNSLAHIMMPVIFRLMYCCGMRPQEPIYLKRRDINLETGDIFIRKAKDHKERHILMSKDMIELLRLYDSYFGQREWFFEDPKTGDHISRTWMTVTFKRILKRPECRIDNSSHIRPYDLRHNFATHNIMKWLDEGRDIMAYLPVLSVYMGHENIYSTMYYIHLIPERLKKSPGVDWELLESVYGGVEHAED